jgi:hypothetical protein
MNCYYPIESSESTLTEVPVNKKKTDLIE